MSATVRTIILQRSPDNEVRACMFVSAFAGNGLLLRNLAQCESVFVDADAEEFLTDGFLGRFVELFLADVASDLTFLAADNDGLRHRDFGLGRLRNINSRSVSKTVASMGIARHRFAARLLDFAP